MSEPRRPVLRYHGGKWLLAPWIISHFPPHRIYTEAFGGGGSVLVRKPRSPVEVYNDLDGEVVNLFRVLRDSPAELERALRCTPYSRAEFQAAYTPSDDPVEQARRTVVRSSLGFGSVGASGRKTGFRYNPGNDGTQAPQDFARLPDVLAATTERLRGVYIENEPAAKVLERYDAPDALHYVDPPYPHATRTLTAKWDTVYRHEMSDDDHRALAETLRGLAGTVVLSGYGCDLYDAELFHDWMRVERMTLGESNTAGRTPRTEVLWINREHAGGQHTLGLGAA